MKPTSPWMDSVPDEKRYPALMGSVETDVCVIGGGIAGVMTAWNLVRAGKSVVLLEKNHIATGDSAATTGFLTRVPDTSLPMIKEKYGTDFLKQLLTATRATQEQLFTLIKSENIACDFTPCDSYYSSYAENNPELIATWEAIQAADPLASLVTRPTGLAAPYTQAIKFSGEGKTNIRKLLLALLERLDKNKIKIFEESEVTDLDLSQGLVSVITTSGTIQAKQIVIATGRPLDYFSELQQLIHPKVSYVAAARYDNPPLSNDLFWDTYDPYFYYRRIDANTIILGGADVDFKEAGAHQPFPKLDSFLKERLAGKHEITHQWSGSLFHTEDGLPYVFSHPHTNNKVFVATGFGGNGLIFSTLAARVIADLINNMANEAAPLLGLSRTGTTIAVVDRSARRAPSVKQWIALAKTSDISTSRPLCRLVRGQKIAIFKVGAEFHAINNTCSHAGGSLCDGEFEGKIIQCPLHGARFDVTSGAVVGPPATRPQTKYPLRIVGNNIEIEVALTDAPAPNSSSTQRSRHWKQLLIFLPIPTVLWALEFLYQYYYLIPKEFGGALLRSAALSGATLIGAALFTSAIFKWWPRLAQYWRIRRYLGVSGLVLVVVHVLSVSHYLFNWQIQFAYYSFNPIKNPIIFGSIALPIFLAMALTSTDWAVEKLGARRWKNLHRLVYIAYLSAIFHFVFINPDLLKNPAGYLLLSITALALLGQLYWYFKISAKRKFQSIGTYIGAVIIIAALVIGYVLVKSKFLK
ncbi:MAG: FAD-dependent oxidoreductase [Candidatus Magasanikbacteria bacterium]|nr:FAD-dependent oxidoreductase [Candidatus Magasanikbacteria bacterium]